MRILGYRDGVMGVLKLCPLLRRMSAMYVPLAEGCGRETDAGAGTGSAKGFGAVVAAAGCGSENGFHVSEKSIPKLPSPRSSRERAGGGRDMERR